jgi:hypothetical protein
MMLKMMCDDGSLEKGGFGKGIFIGDGFAYKEWY